MRKKWIVWGMVLALPLLAGGAWAGAGPGEGGAVMTSHEMNLEQTVGPELYRAAGLERLDPKARQMLADWIHRHVAEAVAHTERMCRRQGPGGPGTWQTPGGERP